MSLFALSTIEPKTRLSDVQGWLLTVEGLRLVRIMRRSFDTTRSLFNGQRPSQM
ncbi:hypothetical protein HDE77_000299 [Rhodanobacter sp. MP7CTX1]|nr:hypothetical protein [Rhodanobacter sp. MP7CTX1]